MRPSCCVAGCCSTSEKLYNCGSCEEWLHEGCTRPLDWPLNLYCIFCPDCQREPWLQGAFIQVGAALGKAGDTQRNIRSAVEDTIRRYVESRKAAGRTTKYSGLRSAGRDIYHQWEKMTDQHPDCNVGFRYERVPGSGSLRRSQVRWRLAMDWGDAPKTIGPQDGDASMQLPNAAEEAAGPDIETAAATPAAGEPAIHEAAAAASTDGLQRDSTATAAPLTCPENADPTEAALEARSALEVQLSEDAHDMQAVSAASMFDTSSTQALNATQEPSCDAPDNSPCRPVASLAKRNIDQESAPQEPTESATALIPSGNHTVLSRGEPPCTQQSGIAAKHAHSLDAAAPKPARNQTIPSMFKKRKAQLVQLPQHLRVRKIPCVEVIDLVSKPPKPPTPAASDTTSRGDFGSGPDKPEVIVIDDEEDIARDAGAADQPKAEVKAAAASPVLSAVKQPVDKQALVLAMIESLKLPRVIECFKQEQQKCAGSFVKYSGWINSMYIGLQETLQDVRRLPLSEQENYVANFFRVFFGLRPSV